MLAITDLRNLQLNDQISVRTYGPVDAKAQFDGVLLARLNAKGLPGDANAASHHANIYRLLPDSLKAIYADDWQSYNYLMVEEADGQIRYIGEAWLIQEAIYINTVASAQITLSDFRDPDATYVKNLLIANGYTVEGVKITT